ncbi:MAG: hypothetical protein KJ044_01625 [Planctomycetes bacterium]|nr:hypothetical protein [Planctomycetota bacterium]
MRTKCAFVLVMAAVLSLSTTVAEHVNPRHDVRDNRANADVLINQEKEPEPNPPAPDKLDTFPWIIVDTSKGVIRLNRSTGQASLMVQSPEKKIEWAPISESVTEQTERELRIISREKRMITAVRGATLTSRHEGAPCMRVKGESLEFLGLMDEDIILSVNGVPCKSNLENAISEQWHGETRRAILQVYRNGGTFNLGIPAVE